MAVTNERSAQLTKMEAIPRGSLGTDEWHGRLRPAQFDHTQSVAGDANSTVGFVRLPAGRVRLFLFLSRIAHSAFGASRVLDLGWEAYKDRQNKDVAADADGLDVGQDVSGAASYNPVGTVGGGESMLFESADGVVIAATVRGGTIPLNATLNGHLFYVLD